MLKNFIYCLAAIQFYFLFVMIIGMIVIVIVIVIVIMIMIVITIISWKKNSFLFCLSQHVISWSALTV